MPHPRVFLRKSDARAQNGEVAAFFTWEGFRPFLVLGAPLAVKANVSLHAT